MLLPAEVVNYAPGVDVAVADTALRHGPGVERLVLSFCHWNTHELLSEAERVGAIYPGRNSIPGG